MNLHTIRIKAQEEVAQSRVDENIPEIDIDNEMH